MGRVGEPQNPRKGPVDARSGRCRNHGPVGDPQDPKRLRRARQQQSRRGRTGAVGSGRVVSRARPEARRQSRKARKPAGTCDSPLSGLSGPRPRGGPAPYFPRKAGQGLFAARPFWRHPPVPRASRGTPPAGPRCRRGGAASVTLWSSKGVVRIEPPSLMGGSTLDRSCCGLSAPASAGTSWL